MYKVILLTAPWNKGRYLLPLMDKSIPSGGSKTNLKVSMAPLPKARWWKLSEETGKIRLPPPPLATMAFNTTQCEPRKSLGGVKGASTDMPEFRRLEVLMFGQQMVSSPRARA